MNHIQFGRIKVITGERGGRFPFCNSLFIDDSVKVVVDPGAGPDIARIKEGNYIDLVINTHYHFDHITYNYIFTDSKIYLNEIESNCFLDRKEIPRRLGMTEVYGEEWVTGWLDRISRPDSPQSPYSPQNRHEWWSSTARLDGKYRWGEIFDFGNEKMEIIGTPGHTAGFSCLYFPGHGLVYIGDIDLTSFGPFYGGSDADIDLLIDSVGKIAELDADTYVTGHEAGVLCRKDFLLQAESFLEIIDSRDQKILSALSTPLTLKEIAGLGLIYGKKYLADDWVRAWEEVMIKKHLRRLANRGMVKLVKGKYKRQ